MIKIILLSFWVKAQSISHTKSWKNERNRRKKTSLLNRYTLGADCRYFFQIPDNIDYGYSQFIKELWQDFVEQVKNIKRVCKVCVNSTYCISTHSFISRKSAKIFKEVDIDIKQTCFYNV